MAITVTCGNCQQPWAVVPGIAKAHPGRTSEPVTVRVPDEDVFGKVHGYVERQSARWISDGPSARLGHQQTAQETVYVWSCLCGAALEHRTPRQYLVTCQHGVREGGLATMCSVAAIRKNPPADLYVNARYGGACPCCGHQGTHWVTWDQAAPCGARPVLEPTAP